MVRTLTRLLRHFNTLCERAIEFCSLAHFTRRTSRRVPPSLGPTSQEVLFFPYGTPVCRLQHRAVAGTLGHLANPARVLPLKPRHEASQAELAEFEIPRGELVFDSFSELVLFLEQFVGGDPILSRGLMDDFSRKCSNDVYRGDYRVSKEYLVSAVNDIVSGRRSTENASAVVLAESSYLSNRALMAAARDRGIPSWILNPDGQWLRLHETQDENFWVQSVEETAEEIRRNPDILAAAKAYAAKRFAGKSLADLDSSRAFAGNNEIPEALRGKKILGLHAFRDSSQLPMENRIPERQRTFNTYFEWTDFVLSVIARNPDEWAIRPHPSRKFYRGDVQILDHLLAKYNLVGMADASSLSTGALLRNRVPIYTHSGHIGLETAVFGYKGHTCSTRFPRELIRFADSPEACEEALELDYESAAGESASSELQDVATVLLYRRFNPPFRAFSPDIPQPDWSSKWKFQKSLLDQQMSLRQKMKTAEGQRVVSEASREIIEAINVH